MQLICYSCYSSYRTGGLRERSVYGKCYEKKNRHFFEPSVIEKDLFLWKELHLQMFILRSCKVRGRGGVDRSLIFKNELLILIKLFLLLAVDSCGQERKRSLPNGAYCREAET